MSYSSKQEIKAAIKELRAKGSEASFGAAGCDFVIPKSTAIDILKEKINVAEEAENGDVPGFVVSVYNFDGRIHVAISAGSEDS